MSDLSISAAQGLVADAVFDIDNRATPASTDLAQAVRNVVHILNTLENGGYQVSLTAPTRLLANEILKAHRENQARLASLLDGLKRLAE